MNKLLTILLIPLCTMSMETPSTARKLLTTIPLQGDCAKLTSFAESMVLGKLRIGTQMSAGLMSVCFNFDDFCNPEITYSATQEQAWDATRYILGTQLKDEIEHESKRSFSDDCCLEDLNRFKAYQATRISECESKLAALNVSKNLPTLTNSLQKVGMELKELESDTGDSEPYKTLNSVLIIQRLQKIKQDPEQLRALAFVRFHNFWEQKDLEVQTQKDRERNFTQIKQKRNQFFFALEHNETEILCRFRESINSIIAKEKPTTHGVINKMINLVVRNRHLDNGSPQNSDDEIW